MIEKCEILNLKIRFGRTKTLAIICTLVRNLHSILIISLLTFNSIFHLRNHFLEKLFTSKWSLIFCFWRFLKRLLFKIRIAAVNKSCDIPKMSFRISLMLILESARSLLSSRVQLFQNTFQCSHSKGSRSAERIEAGF